MRKMYRVITSLKDLMVKLGIKSLFVIKAVTWNGILEAQKKKNKDYKQIDLDGVD